MIVISIVPADQLLAGATIAVSNHPAATPASGLQLMVTVVFVVPNLVAAIADTSMLYADATASVSYHSATQQQLMMLKMLLNDVIVVVIISNLHCDNKPKHTASRCCSLSQPHSATKPAHQPQLMVIITDAVAVVLKTVDVTAIVDTSMSCADVAASVSNHSAAKPACRL